MLDYLPNNFKMLDGLDLPGQIAGSAEPENIPNLEAIYKQGIRSIYNLLETPNLILKDYWESQFADTEYITQINNLSIAIEDFNAPSQEQLELIVNDIGIKLENAQNVLVHCHGGVGRTGTILAALYMKVNQVYNAEKAIGYIRQHYSRYAVESEEQEEALNVFADKLKHQKGSDESTPKKMIFTEMLKNSQGQCKER